MQQAAAYNAAYTYAAAGHAAAIAASAQLPRHIRPIRVVPNQVPAHTSARPSPFNAAALGRDQYTWGGSPMCSIDGSHRAHSSSSTATPTHAHSSTTTPTAVRESLASTALVPGSAGWEASIKKLLGLHDGTSWLVQSPHITGAHILVHTHMRTCSTNDTQFACCQIVTAHVIARTAALFLRATHGHLLG